MRRLSNPFPYDVVWVKWDDAESTYGWELESALDPKEALATTVGFLVKETPTHIVIASSVSHEEEEGHTTNNRLQIPKGMIKETIIIKNGTNKKPIPKIPSVPV